MPGTEPGKIRNVAVIGHRGTGKTSLVEALLFETGTVNRLGSVAEKTTVTDHDDEERRRGMSISASVTHLEWEGRTINLIDTLQDPNADDPSTEMTRTEVREALAGAIGKLPDREKTVITLYYYDELTLREIGEVLGVTESRVSQLHTKAVLGLRSHLQAPAV